MERTGEADNTKGGLRDFLEGCCPGKAVAEATAVGISQQAFRQLGQSLRLAHSLLDVIIRKFGENGVDPR